MINQAATQSYTDFSALSDLRRHAKQDPQATLRAVAQQFESLYINMMLKSMRQASLGDPLFDSNNSGLYRDMYDNQIAMQMSKQKGMGLADMLVQQLSRHIPNQVTSGADEPAPVYTAAKKPISSPSRTPDPTRFENHEQFVNTLLPYAEQAADELGVSPQVLIAQAALETGWGDRVQRLADGRSSYNLFNIKADSRWSGDRLPTNTLEYRHGVMSQEPAEFRVYKNYAESFADYVTFIKSNPRYQPALAVAGNPEDYVSEIHKAGYATDPDYTRKVMDVMKREAVGAPYSDYLVES